MPYIHPVLGVPCITNNEFWESEAKAEGREATDLINDYHQEMLIDMERERQRLLNDKEGALEMLRDYYHPDNDDVTFIPTEVVNILEASCNYNMRSSTTSITAEINCSDGKTRIVEYTESQYGGSYMEPPDYDCNCKIIKE